MALNVQDIAPKGSPFLLQLAFHPPPTLSFYHNNLFCPSCVAYCAWLSSLSSPGSHAQTMEIWLSPQTAPSLLASKRGCFSKGSSSCLTKSALKWALNRCCKLAISFIAGLIALSRAAVDRLAGYSS